MANGSMDNPMDVYLDGKMVPAGQALVPVDDAGFQHAVGLFETLAVTHGQAFRLDQHVARLIGSARDLGLSKDLDAAALAGAVRQTIEHNRLDAARVRLTVTAGSLSLLGPAGDAPPQPTVVVTASPPTRYDPAYFDEGITALIARPGANPFDPTAGHKTLAYWSRLRTLRQAAAAGAGEAIWLNVTNHLASGAVSNVFLVKGQTLLTPYARGEEVPEALPAPVLPGVTRAAVIELAHTLDLPVQRQMLSVNDLLEADEVFLTNSSWGVLPVSHVEKKQIGTPGKAGGSGGSGGSAGAGSIARRLREALLALIEKETGS